ncbi:hypothetical protein CLAFUW4_10660 [Fulvia fulva]|uniref:Uncharacterized protein n=1 Tax=Passalora fulva TaxID=5499 RepID=A0A9Q8LGH5_PASFU|nr:uncharacterized protein CLAFUR5_05273 [Fulvia fulva]KAK4616148.1 hypothetical protein CLAFUR4_10665 [Fulvia fulva]KAK4617142.1 hypothetical protein CLAFUR0_10578 [Fulvia fulva]UJO16968.1 hypothetical protein CLAFUR5_05273 [Fulvia fulva]WPV19327.1 hypothetical protein CLAFUW4_10660 [Fulvia fulva]WPV33935.1 hypothetical protein CLAFUW7_10662 [Fulvia fulva]
MYKAHVAEQYAKISPPRPPIDLDAIRAANPKLQPKDTFRHVKSTLAFDKEGHRAVAFPCDGIEQKQWEKEYDDGFDRSWKVEYEGVEGLSEAAVEEGGAMEVDDTVENEVIDLTQEDDSEPVAKPRAQVPQPLGRRTFRQMIKADMKERTQGL